MDDLLEEFVAETREMASAIEGELIAWERDPADHARLDAIFRFVHTVKGNCGFFDFPQLERLSHAAESVLAEVRANRRTADSALVSAILAIIDQIVELTNAIDAGRETAEGGAAIGTIEGDPATGDRLIAALDAGAIIPDAIVSPPIESSPTEPAPIEPGPIEPGAIELEELAGNAAVAKEHRTDPSFRAPSGGIAGPGDERYVGHGSGPQRSGSPAARIRE